MLISSLAVLCITATSPVVSISGNWGVSVPAQTAKIDNKAVVVKKAASFKIAPPSLVSVNNEEHKSLDAFKTDGRWLAGSKCCQTAAVECSVPGAIDPNSIHVKSSPDGPEFAIDKDYKIEPMWGEIGRVDGGSISANTPVWIDYTYHTCRIDSVVVDSKGNAKLLKGEDNVFWAKVPTLPKGCKRFANIWVPGYAAKLSKDMIYPIKETQYKPDKASARAMRKYIPKVWEKLTSGGTVRVLAWGDSVTDGSFLPSSDKWQNQFARRLQQAYPKATIELTSEAWGGRSSFDYMAQPAGSPKNFKEKVLDAKPDLIVSEFINDCGHYPTIESLTKAYSVIDKDFKDNGIEWIILTPHYDTWQHQPNFGDKVEKDTRPYVSAVREYASQNNIALADATLRWDHLASEGIPYSTLLVNAINHPSAQGMKLFADTLMDIFEK